MSRPTTPLPLIFATRGLVVWALARAAAGLTLVLAGAPPREAFVLAPSAALLVVGVAAALGHVDVARRGERALLGNFGVSRMRLTAWVALPALAGELALGALAGTLG